MRISRLTYLVLVLFFVLYLQLILNTTNNPFHKLGLSFAAIYCAIASVKTRFSSEKKKHGFILQTSLPDIPGVDALPGVSSISDFT